MDKVVMNKMARYVELSDKFSKTERDIFTDDELKSFSCDGTFIGSVGNIAITSGGGGSISIGDMASACVSFGGPVMIDGREIYVDEKGDVKSRDPKKPLTRGEQLEANTIVAVHARAVLLDEYDEYIKLRASLKGYFKGANNLIND